MLHAKKKHYRCDVCFEFADAGRCCKYRGLFIDLKKTYNRVRETLWYCRRKSGVPGKYEDSKTVVRCAVGVRDVFKVDMRLQGISFEPSLVCSGDEQVDR